jgi:hypothetical protein
MHDLLQDYLKNNTISSYKDGDLINYAVDGHIATLRFRYDNDTSEKTITANIWDVLAFVHNKRK